MDEKYISYDEDFQELLQHKKASPNVKAPRDLFVNLANPGVACLSVDEDSAVFEIPKEAKDQSTVDVDIVTCDSLVSNDGTVVSIAYKCMGCCDIFTSVDDSYSFCPRCGRPIKHYWKDFQEYKENHDKEVPATEEGLTSEILGAIFNADNFTG